MTFHGLFYGLGSGPSKLRRALSMLAVATILSFGLLVATQRAADAATGLITSNSSWLNVGVRNGSVAAGTDLIQWYATDRDDQQWHSFRNAGGLFFQNINSGDCITTDGVAGDPLTQQACDTNNTHQQWQDPYVWWAAGVTVYNPASGLDMDVQGDSHSAGAEIDGWYPNNQINQVFASPGTNLFS